LHDLARVGADMRPTRRRSGFGAAASGTAASSVSGGADNVVP
jgi:hypothetical protein